MKFFNLSLLFILICNLLVNVNAKEATVKSNIPGISGSIPVLMDRIIKETNNLSSGIEIKNGFCNRLFFHGAPGNGKTTFAHKIAEVTNSELIKIKGSEIVMQPKGSEVIKEAFEYALKSANNNKRTVVFIDEVDAIASKVNRNSVCQSLWLWLDEIKKNSKIFVIVATNKFSDIEPALTGRFGLNIIELNNPRGGLRKEIINFYIQKINMEIDKNFSLDDKRINDLVKQTQGVNIRGIEYVIYGLKQNPKLDVENVVKVYKADPYFTKLTKDVSALSLESKIALATTAGGVAYKVGPKMAQVVKDASPMIKSKVIVFAKKVVQVVAKA